MTGTDPNLPFVCRLGSVDQ